MRDIHPAFGNCTLRDICAPHAQQFDKKYILHHPAARRISTLLISQNVYLKELVYCSQYQHLIIVQSPHYTTISYTDRCSDICKYNNWRQKEEESEMGGSSCMIPNISPNYLLAQGFGKNPDGVFGSSVVFVVVVGVVVVVVVVVTLLCPPP